MKLHKELLNARVCLSILTRVHQCLGKYCFLATPTIYSPVTQPACLPVIWSSYSPAIRPTYSPMTGPTCSAMTWHVRQWLGYYFTSDSVNMFINDFANMFTSELATMFSSDLVNMFMSELETWKNMTCIKNATLHLVIETLMDECKRRTSFTLFAVNVPHYQLSCIPKKWLCSMQRSFKKRIIYFSFLFYFFFFFWEGRSALGLQKIKFVI